MRLKFRDSLLIGISHATALIECRESSEFNREHTLERWAEAVEAAIRAAQNLPQVTRNKTLIIGHSEGGLVACRVARDLPKIVTHVASLAGGGPSQLFDLLTLTRKGNFFRDVSENPDERVKFLLDKWQAIQVDPTSAEKFFFGFAYRRWSTFLVSSPIDELLNTSAKIYIAQGAEDQAVDPASSDALYAQLLAKGKQAVYDRVEGANHSFNINSSPKTDGWKELHKRIVMWFLES
jgi:predicted esterase